MRKIAEIRLLDESGVYDPKTFQLTECGPALLRACAGMDDKKEDAKVPTLKQLWQHNGQIDECKQLLPALKRSAVAKIMKRPDLATEKEPEKPLSVDDFDIPISDGHQLRALILLEIPCPFHLFTVVTGVPKE